MIGNCIGGAGEFSSQMISRVSPVPVKGPSRRLAEAQAAKKAPYSNRCSQPLAVLIE
jgi:hypothetical protein